MKSETIIEKLFNDFKLQFETVRKVDTDNKEKFISFCLLLNTTNSYLDVLYPIAKSIEAKNKFNFFKQTIRELKIKVFEIGINDKLNVIY